MPENKTKFLVAVHLLLEKDGKLLLLRRFNTGYEDGNYSVIAGHLEGGENVLQAAAREAKEEAEITISPQDMQVVHVMHRKSREEWVNFFINTIKWQGEPSNAEPDKCDELKWFDRDGLPKNIVPYVRAALENIDAGIFFSLYGWPQV